MWNYMFILYVNKSKLLIAFATNFYYQIQLLPNGLAHCLFTRRLHAARQTVYV